jgi:hypothetical protein
MLVAAIVAALIVALFSIDLGPAVRKQAEERATKYLERPMHIGKLKALLRPGEFELDDVVIEGEHPADRPFFTAKRIHVSVPWWTIFRKQLFVDVELAGWTMTVETSRTGTHLPKLTRPAGKKKSYTTTVRHVYADGGQFTYLDHVTPWSVIAPNLNFDLVRASNLNAYVGTASFDRGSVQIQKYLPMSAKMTTRFTLDAPLVRLHHIDLITDGARTSLTGSVDFNRFPEQSYQIESRLNLPRMREIFFANEAWRVGGDAQFTGRFHLFKGGYELGGRFGSDFATLLAGGRLLQFPNLQGNVSWVPKQFAVSDASADFYGGRAGFTYALAPLGASAPATAAFDVTYDDVDLPAFIRAINWRDMDLRGRASGRNAMTWTNGRFGETRNASGDVTITPPPSVSLSPADLPSTVAVVDPEVPFVKDRPLGALPMGGAVHYRFDSKGLDFDPSWVASPSTYVSFRGHAGFGGASDLPFHVTSLDWQASDRLLSAILTSAGARTGAVPVAGYGQFNGVMTGPFSQPVVSGRFAGDAIWSWGVNWGRAVGDIVIENSYVTVTNGVIGDEAQGSIRADGKFSLGYPRKDRGEEINGRVRVHNWPLKDFRAAFNLNDWPMDGVVGEADITLTGPYTAPFGKGTLRIDRGVAWGETFDSATGNLTFIGTGLEITPITMTKGPGRVRGSATIYWDGSYSFDADGDKILVESLTSFTMPKAPLSGVLDFRAHGAGNFDHPQYEFRAHVPDLSISSQGIGDVSGVLQVRNNVLLITQLEAASGLLQASGTGSIALTGGYDSNLTFRFTDTSIDPYLPFIAPAMAPKISQYTRARVGGSLQIQGELSHPETLNALAVIDDARLTLLTYELRNQGELRMTLKDNAVGISHLVLVGEGTKLSLEGDIPLSTAPVNLRASGDANLAILQGFFPNLISSGAAVLNATIAGTGAEPRFSGQAQISDGRVRYRTFPHGLEHINGPITFDATSIDVAGLRAQMGGGDVQFGGNIRLNGYAPEQFNLTAEGRSMRLHYPTGFASTVDASLSFVGPIGTPTLGGTVTVLRSSFQGEIDNDFALVRLAVGTAAAGLTTEPTAVGEPSLPVRFDLRVNAPGTLAIDTKDAQVYGSANLDVRGNWDTLSVTGLVTIDRGNIFFAGNRFTVRPGQIRLSNPSTIDPFFDVEVATRARRGAQTYDITSRVTGTIGNLNLTIASDPFLPTYDVMLLMFGELPNVNSAELHSAAPQLSQQQVMRTAAAQILSMPISSRVGSVVQRTIPFDTFSIVPLLGDEAALGQLRAGARVTVGQRISNRTFLTYSRALNQQGINQYDVFLLEYEQSDRLSWVLSRTNESQQATFALDFRLRHVF